MMNALNIKMLVSVILAAIASSPAALHAAAWVEQSDQWEQRFPVATATPTLVISNIWGDVRVSVGPVDEIWVKVSEHRRAPTQALFDRSLDVLPLTLSADDQGVSLIVGKPHQRRQHDPCRGCQLDVQFDVTIPAGSQIDVSTVNDGKVDVDGVTGLVSARNVNGPVRVSGAHQCGRVKSINGAVQLQLVQVLIPAPGEGCELETINGNITLQLPADAGLDLAMELFNGSLRTEFEVESMAMTPKVEKSRKGNRLRYEISQAGGLRIGAGGANLFVKSLNGDIQINKL